MLTKLRDWLKGKKTYLVAAGGIITALIGWSQGDLTAVQAVMAILGALGFGALSAKGNRANE